jgi:putative FmdB family regulatory protein
MPIYEYQCVDCNSRDQRVAGLDDHTALCTQCGGLMLRLDEDVFKPYFEEVAPQAWPETVTKTKASL